MTPAEMVALVNGDNLGVRMIVNACASRLIDEAEARPGTPEFAGILEAARCLHRLSDEISALGKNERPVASADWNGAANSWSPVSYEAMGRWMLEEAAANEFVRAAPLVSRGRT